MKSLFVSRLVAAACAALMAGPCAWGQAELSGDTANSSTLQRMIRDQFDANHNLPRYDQEIQKAYSFLAEGNFNEAYRHLNYAIKEDPNRAEAYVGFAIAARAKQQYPAAERALNKAMEVEPDNVRVRHERARLLLIKQLPEDALTEIDQAIKLDGGEDWNTQQVRAETLVALNRVEEAANLYPQIVALLEAKLTEVNKMIIAEEGKEEIVAMGKEYELVNDIGGGIREIEVLRFDTVPKEAPAQWLRVRARLRQALAAAQARAEELTNVLAAP